MGPKGVCDIRTDRPTDRWSQHELNSTLLVMDMHKVAVDCKEKEQGRIV
jgi:hypothetical protein